LNGIREIPDLKTYLSCLASLHKRRKKYSLILRAQPIPKMIQVSPRALVEFGSMQPDALASWLTWRKWFYDLDNRSAQETGYLFEPILAAALGGEAKGSKNSPIKRTDDPSKGRQVDFVLGKWLPGEGPVIAQKIDKSIEMIESFAAIGLDRTMTICNALNFEI
jgi:hypothetical protein